MRLMQIGNGSLNYFCALEYKPEEGHATPGTPHILMILVRSKLKKLRLLVAPDWRIFVQPRDYEYIASLLDDFKQRAAQDDGLLLKQVSSLAVGPLVTYRTGAKLQDNADLLDLSHSFKEL
jgi:hypothetical protein